MRQRVVPVVVLTLLAALVVGAPANAASATPPEMRLPYAQGFTALTSGPHTWDGTATGPRGSVDFGSADGSLQPVYAAAAGRAWVYGDLGWSRCYVVVDHGDGWMTAYYHLRDVPADLNGKTVAAGALVGTMGAIGVDTCGGGTPGYRHVHFVLLRDGDEHPIDGLRIGGYTIHEAPGAYCGWWTRNSDGATVASSLTLDPPTSTWPQGRCPRMEPGLTNSQSVPVPVLSPTPTPTISGTAAVGQTLTAVPGTWGPAPVTLTYQWYRGSAAVSGATAATYAVTSADVGAALKVAVTGSKSGYPSVTMTSAATTTVPGATLSPTPTPTVSGTARVGQTLTAVPGTWGPAPVTLTYRWYRGSTAISGATASTYVVQTADVGATLKVSVTGSKSGYTSVTTTSAPTAAVTAAAVLSPTPTPTITGTARVGQRLTAVPGTWGPAPVTLSYRWYRGSTAISGATSASYVLQPADRGATIRVAVTGSRSGYPSVTKTSAATATVASGVLSPTPTPAISGTARVGRTLTAVPGTWGPAPVTLRYQWYRGSTAISGATAKTYVLRSSDRGWKLRVVVTGSKSGYTTVSKTSAWTATVAR